MHDQLREQCMIRHVSSAWSDTSQGKLENILRQMKTMELRKSSAKKEMATHSSVLAWRIPGTGEPGGLPSVGSHRVGHD